VREIVLIRHAQSEANIPEGSIAVDNYSALLTSLGKTQAEDLKQFLKKVKFTPDLVIHSPFTRAVDTANLIFPKVRKQIDHTLQESSWMSEIIKGIHGMKYLKLQDHEIPPLAQEVFQQNIQDLLQLVSELSNNNKRIAVVAHAAILTALYHAISNPQQRLTQDMLTNIMKNFQYCRGFWFDRVNNQLVNPEAVQL
jgi:broad specificity phosphatase PhoE